VEHKDDAALMVGCAHMPRHEDWRSTSVCRQNDAHEVMQPCTPVRVHTCAFLWPLASKKQAMQGYVSRGHAPHMHVHGCILLGLITTRKLPLPRRLRRLAQHRFDSYLN
jgi:hypothetical protein